MSLPSLVTPRLMLRSFTQADAETVKLLAGATEVAQHTTNIPHPYQIEHAQEWISTHATDFDNRRNLTLAIQENKSNQLIGCISLRLDDANFKAEMGYWLGVPYWGRGYATEAGAALIRYGFEHLNLNRIAAYHFASNPASGRVMQKIGMTREGQLRQNVFKDGAFHDAVVYGILRQP